jgi:hypothetical protein
MFLNETLYKYLNTLPQKEEEKTSSYVDSINTTPFEYINTMQLIFNDIDNLNKRKKDNFVYNLKKKLQQIRFNFTEDNQNKICYNIFFNLFKNYKFIIEIINCPINIDFYVYSIDYTDINNIKLVENIKVSEKVCFNLLTSIKLNNNTNRYNRYNTYNDLNDFITFNNFEENIIKRNLSHLSKDKIIFNILYNLTKQGHIYTGNLYDKYNSTVLLMRQYAIKTGTEIDYTGMKKHILRELINHTHSFKIVSKIISKFLKQNSSKILELFEYIINNKFLYQFSIKNKFLYQWDIFIKIIIEINPQVFIRFYENLNKYYTFDYLNKQIFRSKCNIIFHYFVKNINICYVNNTELIFVYNEICSLNINETNFDKIIIINEKIIFSCITVNTKRLSTTNEFIPKDEPTCKCCFDDMNDEDSKDKTFLVLSCKHLICLDCAKSIRNNQCIICRKELYSSDDILKYKS